MQDRGTPAAVTRRRLVPLRPLERLLPAVLGPSMTYSCAVWENSTGVGLEEAQAAKHELVCQKLALRPGMRLLDVGCGWGGMALHAAQHHGVEVGRRHALANQVEAADGAGRTPGWPGRSTSACRTTGTSTTGRSTPSAPSACSSTSGASGWPSTSPTCTNCCARRGACSTTASCRPAVARATPSRSTPRRRSPADLHQPLRLPRRRAARARHGDLVHAAAGLRDRHAKALREHYGLTFAPGWPTSRPTGTRPCASPASGARVWRLYTAASAVGFEDARIQGPPDAGHPTEDGRSGFPLRPRAPGYQLTHCHGHGRRP